MTTQQPPREPARAFPGERSDGMTLRDYFAAMVLAGMHARDTFDTGQATPEQRAALAYIDADAMMSQRKQQP